jgi:hypothetical protein
VVVGVREGPPGEVLAYAQLLSIRAGGSLGGHLRAAYLHGSAVLGGWMPGRSDVDVLLVTDNAVPGRAVEAVAAVLAASGRRCPGSGLECSVVTAGQAASPHAPWPFLPHVRAGPDDARARVVRGDELPGDPDLLMHYAVCRAAGWPAHGPGPPELIGAVGRRAILGYLAGELRWGAEHQSEAYAVLNACRALVFLADGQIVSKVAGGSIALARGLGPPALIDRALDQQHGMSPEQAAAPDARDYILAAAAALRSAAETGAGSSA